MEAYLIKSTACLLILFLFYKIVLENETMHRFKRFYLLGSLVASFVIPWITFTTYLAPTAVVTNSNVLGSLSVISSETEVATNYLPVILWTLYSIGVLFFSFRFAKNLKTLIVKINRNPKQIERKITNVLLQQEVTPHTFLRYIFLNKREFESHTIPSEVLLHEQTHALQKHSIDVLFIEVVQIIFWFNPLVYFLKHAIKLNHEFLADQAVIQKGIAPNKYQNLLLAFSSNATPLLANSINYSSIKKRFTVMKTKTSKRQATLRALVLLPLVVLLIFGFSSKEVVQKKIGTTHSEKNTSNVTPEEILMYNKTAAFWNTRFAQPNAERTLPLTELKKLETVYRRMSPDQKANAAPFPDCDLPEKATPEQLVEYNKLVRAYNAMDPNNMLIRKKDVDRVHYIYKLMTEEQRKKAEAFPNFPPLPPIPPSPEPPIIEKGVYDIDPNTPPPPAPKAPKVTDTELKEYNELANKYKFTDRTKMSVKKKDIERLNFIYNKMTASQRTSALPYPNFPPPPPGAFPAQDPAGYLIQMANKGATFYIGKDKVSAEKAIEIVRENDSFQFEVKNENSKNPIVQLIGC